MTMARCSMLLAAMGFLGLAAGASIEITSPDSTSSYHAGDAVPVQWFYEGEGENFSIFLLKSGDQVADLCAAEENGVCFDLTQDQTVLLPESGLESGSDYTIHVQDESSDAEHVSDSFTIIASSSTNIEITSPDGTVSLSAGDELDVSWLYVGNNELFDIYLRQDGERVSENLCGSESDGSCRSSNPRSATVTLPSEIEDGDNYRLLVVDKVDDDAWGLSEQLPIGVTLSASSTSGVNMSNVSTIGLTIGLCALGVCLVAMCLACCHKVNKDRRREEQRDAMITLEKRRPAATAPLAVEGMQQPDSPEQVPHEKTKSSFCSSLASYVPSSFRSHRKGREIADGSNCGGSNASSPNERTHQLSSPDENC